MATSAALRRTTALASTGRIRRFIPEAVLLQASPDDLTRWQGQLEDLMALGWTAEERTDAERCGRWLTLTPPAEPGGAA